MRFQKGGGWVSVLRCAAGLLCLPVIYMTAYASLPYVKPLLEDAALLSAQMSFSIDGTEMDTLAKEYGEGETSEIDPLAQQEGTELSPSEDYVKDLVPVEDESASSASSAESAEETASRIAPEKPANAGVIQRKTYSAGNTSVYIPLGKGYIKNCTSLSAGEIQKAVSNPPSFTISANGEPEVLIMHTHATESYQDMELDWYDKSYNSRSTDNTRNTCQVGEEIRKELEASGIGVLHDMTLHDYPSYNGAYERSAETVKKYLKQYPSIKVVLDVHRDAIQPDNNTMIAPVTTIDGKPCAQVMIISGCDDGTFNMPNYMENLKFSSALQRQMESDYPTLARPILFDYRKYNQDLTTGSILLEVGGHANTLAEALYCGQLVGKSLAKTLLALR